MQLITLAFLIDFVYFNMEKPHLGVIVRAGEICNIG